MLCENPLGYDANSNSLSVILTLHGRKGKAQLGGISDGIVSYQLPRNPILQQQVSLILILSELLSSVCWFSCQKL